MEHSHKRHGIVKGIREHYDDPKLRQVEVEFPATKPKTKPKKDEAVSPSYKPREQYPVSAAMAEELAVGDPVECETTVRHFGRRHRGMHAGDNGTKEA